MTEKAHQILSKCCCSYKKLILNQVWIHQNRHKQISTALRLQHFKLKVQQSINLMTDLLTCFLTFQVHHFQMISKNSYIWRIKFTGWCYGRNLQLLIICKLIWLSITSIWNNVELMLKWCSEQHCHDRLLNTAIVQTNGIKILIESKNLDAIGCVCHL